MKKVILFSIIALGALCSFNANAQVIEEFEGNSLNWQEYASSRREAVIKEGVLHLKSSGELIFATCTAPIDFTEPFKVTATVKNLKLNSDDKGLAIIFNYSDNFNCDVFYISEETVKYVKLSEEKRARFRDSDFKLNKKLKEHQIVLQYRNRKAELIIDDVQCLEVSYVTMNYNGFGFGVYGNDQEASIEKVEFRQM